MELDEDQQQTLGDIIRAQHVKIKMEKHFEEIDELEEQESDD